MNSHAWPTETTTRPTETLPEEALGLGAGVVGLPVPAGALVDGVAVQCARQNDGTYQWVVPPAP